MKTETDELNLGLNLDAIKTNELTSILNKLLIRSSRFYKTTMTFIGGFTYINPDWFNSLSDEVKFAVLKQECLYNQVATQFKTMSYEIHEEEVNDIFEERDDLFYKPKCTCDIKMIFDQGCKCGGC